MLVVHIGRSMTVSRSKVYGTNREKQDWGYVRGLQCKQVEAQLPICQILANSNKEKQDCQ